MLNRLRKCPIWQGMIWSFQLQLEWFSVVSSFKHRTETSYTYTNTYITSSFPPVLEPPAVHGFLAVRASTTRIEPPVCWLSSCHGEALTVLCVAASLKSMGCQGTLCHVFLKPLYCWFFGSFCWYQWFFLAIYHLYIANWVIIYISLIPPNRGTRNNHWWYGFVRRSPNETLSATELLLDCCFLGSENWILWENANKIQPPARQNR